LCSCHNEKKIQNIAKNIVCTLSDTYHDLFVVARAFDAVLSYTHRKSIIEAEFMNDNTLRREWENEKKRGILMGNKN
jgi:hypothetical protein